uniref:Putative secreted protein n=1 Tax=Ixodes ricinus TaxID=34613 RepID=A0A6B0U0M5_IXORI
MYIYIKFRAICSLCPLFFFFFFSLPVPRRGWKQIAHLQIEKGVRGKGSPYHTQETNELRSPLVHSLLERRARCTSTLFFFPSYKKIRGT